MNSKIKHSNKPILKVSNLSFSYPDQKQPVLKDIHLKLYPQEVRVIVGLSGSGKSTLLNTLCGFIPHSIEGELNGKITIDGKDINNATIYEIAKEISLVQQDPEGQLCTSDVFHEVAFALENFMVPPAKIRSLVRAILLKLGIWHLRNRRLDTLSGGEKQKVAIASMLVLEPKILVFDEPTANLDPSSSRRFVEFIDNLRRETNVGLLIVDHNPSQYIPIADHILVLNHGRIEHVLRSHQFKEFTEKYYNRIIHPKTYRISTLSAKGLTVKQKQNMQYLTKNLEKSYILKMKDLTYKYGSKTILKGITLDIRKGEFIGLMGDNGSGKTTLIQNVIGLLGPTKKYIIYKFNGTSKIAKNTPELAKNIGYVFQNPNHMLFGNTVWDEVMLGPKNFNKDIKSASRTAIELLKLGRLREYRSVHPMLLSHGEKRRLNLASVLCYDPELIILDEPFIGQDPKNVSKILEYLLSIISLGKSVIMITHRAEIVYKYCNRLLFLKNGELILDAPTDVAFNKLELMGEESYLPINITR